MSDIQLITPNWSAPANVLAFTSCRAGGHSSPPFDSLNVAQHVGDNADQVELNRQLLPNHQNFSWLQQVHSNVCIDLPVHEHATLRADAACTSEPQQVCAVMTADCLPLLVCNQQGTEVAAIHAGWRGLADGIIENTVNKMHSQPDELLVWLGPAISQANFEVGEEVYQAFSVYPQAFIPSPTSTDKQPKYLADLYSIARAKLLQLGITQVSGAEYCTYQQQSLFYSHRRATHQGQTTTGRMVSAIYLLEPDQKSVIL